jgi:molybdopterin-guanine dinucleotide biosynthesis protein A
MELTGFVLAGGQSSRMGRDKAMLDWHGHTLLDHMIEKIGMVADRVHVVGRDPLPDKAPGLGPLSGIATGLETTFTSANLFVAVDLPLLTTDFFEFMRTRMHASSRPLLACKIGSVFPLCLGMWLPMLPEIHRSLAAKQFSVAGFIERSGGEIISAEELAQLGFDASIFRNLNTQSDYEAALRL